MKKIIKTFYSTWESVEATRNMGDDQGYCDHLIKTYETYYIRHVGDNGENMCAFCAMRHILFENPELKYNKE